MSTEPTNLPASPSVDDTGHTTHHGDLHSWVNAHSADDTVADGAHADIRQDVAGKADDPHGLGGSAHSADTLAALNAKITDGTLDDAGDPRDPTAHASSHEPGGSDALTVDAAAGTGSLRTLGTGATQALPGDTDMAGAAPVQTVNSETGDVTLDAGDVGADPAGTAASEVSYHEAAADPHPDYLSQASANATYGAKAEAETITGAWDFTGGLTRDGDTVVNSDEVTRIEAVTESEYDNLDPPDPNTLYLITEDN